MRRGGEPPPEEDHENDCSEVAVEHDDFFGDLDDPDSEVSLLLRKWRPGQLHPEYGTDPSVYYVIG